MNTSIFDNKIKKPSLRDEFCVWSNVGGGEAEYEISEEYILPDYLPDIKKILFVKSDVCENDEFIGDGRAEFGGEARFVVCYASDAGTIRCISRSFNYLNGIDLESIYDESVVSSKSYVKNKTVRALSPRKILIKAKVETKITVKNKVCVSPRLTGGSGMEDEFTLERRVNYTDCVDYMKLTERDIRMSEDIEYRGKYPISELLCAVADVVSGECKYADGHISIRGSVRVGFMISAGDGEQGAEWVYRSLPLEHTFAAEGLRDNTQCIAELYISAFEYGVANNSYGESRILEADIGCVAKITACSNERAMFTDDVYSTSYEYKNTYRPVATERLALCFSGNFSSGGTSEVVLPEGGVAPAAVLADGECELEFLSVENGRIRFSGECTVRAVVNGGEGGYITADVVFPLKYEAPFNGNGDYVASVESNVMDVRINVDGNKITANVEIGLCCMLFESVTANTVVQIDIDKSKPHIADEEKSMLLYYPERGEGLWDVAKKYNIPEGLLASYNKDRIREGAVPSVLLIPQNKK